MLPFWSDLSTKGLITTHSVRSEISNHGGGGGGLLVGLNLELKITGRFSVLGGAVDVSNIIHFFVVESGVGRGGLGTVG